ncbi:MAG: nucleotidyltransferase domain-containing protein [Acidimicrobiaceae bacterium]|nr:nucleotidyltransferase domain-containing protein [Acidimicrobiaceae bacterium]MCY4175612.1 nucleotidyltransferase domain-containing protein [Acidimicrobiaceae bacterium]MCY4279340.1 nucleotidyltransferase domain-containing protein [Acidimicrobiaceae bacterium]MCY4294985.1 nucleotidyltransferase domain-containing protein [Acidimicrobiaceae bacterium]
MPTETAPAPTVRDARRAAARLAEAGAGRVLLFGSVARGDAAASSDIDLVAIFDDIDYRERLGVGSVLRAAAESVVGSPVEVFVTDRAEWRRRTQEVSASFEAGIASSAVVLVDRPAGSVRWSKEIGLADNNTDEALGRLDEASKALSSMARSMRPDEWEIAQPHDDRVAHWRLIDVCSAGAMAVETALKALAASHGVSAPHKHRIDLLVPLTGRRADDVSAALAELEANTISVGDEPYGDITVWRSAGTYIADRPDIDPSVVAALAPRIAQAATSVTSIAADELAASAPQAPEIARARRVIELAGGAA